MVSFVTNKEGELLTTANVHVTEQKTGKKVTSEFIDGILSFYGEKGKSYNIAVAEKVHESVSTKVVVPQKASELEKVKIELPDKPVQAISYAMAARVVKSSDQSVLAGAKIKVMTFDAADIELVANELGVVDFALLDGTAYVAIADKDGFSGMHSGIAEKGSDKASMVHAITAHDDTENKLPVVSFVTNKEGELLTTAHVNVIEQATGKKISSEFIEGILSFYGEKGKSYNVVVTSKGHESASSKVHVPEGVSDVKKVEIALAEQKPVQTVSYQMAARVVKSPDQLALAGALIKIMTFDAADVELVANASGIVDFTLSEGTPYVIIADKDGYSGTHSGIAEQGADKTSIIHAIVAYNDIENKLPIVTFVTDQQGEVVPTAQVNVTEQNSGKKVSSEFIDGILSFYGEKGKSYNVAVTSKGHESTSAKVHVPEKATEVEKVNISLLDQKPVKPVIYQMAARVVKSSDEMPLAAAQVKIMTFDAADVELVTNASGIVNFSLSAGTPYVIIADKDGFSGTHSGIAEQGTDKAAIIHNITAHNDVENKLPIVSFVTNKEGEMLTSAVVNVTEQNTGNTITSEFIDGIVSFYGEKGKSYNIGVKDKGHESTITQIHVPEHATVVEKVDISLPDQKPAQPVIYQMAVRVVKASDQSALAGAQIKIMTFDAPDMELVANEAGVVDFSLVEGTAYVAFADKDGFTGIHSGIAETGTDKSTTTHTITVHNDIENKLPIVSFVTNQEGEMLTTANVHVTEKLTGEKTPSEFKEGVLSFYGEKGKAYNISVESINHRSTLSYVNVPLEATAVDKVTIALTENKSMQPPDLYQMSAHVFKLADNAPLAGAEIKIITFEADDRELVTDKTGNVDFSLEEGSPYVVMATKDGLSGMHSGLVEPGTDKASIVHAIPVHGDPINSIPVVGLLSTYNEAVVDKTIVKIVDVLTGKSIDFMQSHGVVTFLGKKGHTYNLETTSPSSSKQTKEIEVKVDATKPIQWQLELHENTDQTERLIIFNNLTEPDRYFLVKGKENHEVVTSGDGLYLQNGGFKTKYCKGSLAKLDEDPKSFINEHGLKINDVIRIKNVYFDFDKSILDEHDKTELDKISVLLQSNTNYKLQVNTHADDRGRDSYNQRLSEKRAAAIVKYLNRSVSTKRLIPKAYGESVLAVPCVTAACSENDHQKNRRAEFSLLLGGEANSLGEHSGNYIQSKHVAKGKNTNLEYSKILDIYGNKKIVGLEFKINIGAYRYNSSLEFPMLKGLGTIEVSSFDDITYYLLSSYPTLNKAESVRADVIQKGIADASVSIYYMGEKISLSTMKSLIQ